MPGSTCVSDPISVMTASVSRNAANLARSSVPLAAGSIGWQATSIPILTEGGVSCVCRPPYPGWNMTVCVRLIRAGTWPPSEFCRQRSVITGPGCRRRQVSWCQFRLS